MAVVVRKVFSLFLALLLCYTLCSEYLSQPSVKLSGANRRFVLVLGLAYCIVGVGCSLFIKLGEV